MTRGLFITGTGTGVGKTLVTAALCWQIRGEGLGVQALKPVLSGYKATDKCNDAAVLLRSMGKSVNKETVAAIAPWRYKAPLSPHLAARKEVGPVAAKAVAQFCRMQAKASAVNISLVEGAGGILSPLNERETMRDLARQLTYPCIMVGGTYLGAISHMLCALESLAQTDLQLRGVVISQSEHCAGLAETAEAIGQFAQGSVNVYTIARTTIADEPWKSVPSLKALWR